MPIFIIFLQKKKWKSKDSMENDRLKKKKNVRMMNVNGKKCDITSIVWKTIFLFL